MLSSRSNYFKSILLYIAIIFIFLSVGAEFLHNHSDSEFHNDCPVCHWLINSVFAFVVFLIIFLLLLSFKPVLFNATQIPIVKAYQASQYLRSPPILV